MYSEASIIAACPGCERWSRVKMALRSCSGIANLLSIRTQVFTTAAFVQNWAMYDPSLLKDCTPLLVIAVLIGPRNGSSPVSSPSKSTSKSPGKSTTFFLSGVTNVSWLLMALTPNLIAPLCLACFVCLCLRHLSRSWARAFRVDCPRAATNRSRECLTLARFRACMRSIRLGRIMELALESPDRCWLEVRKLGELVEKFSTQLRRFVCSSVLFAKSIVLVEVLELFRVEFRVESWERLFEAFIA